MVGLLFTCKNVIYNHYIRAKSIQALVVHEIEATEILNLDFVIKDSDNMQIDDFAMIEQWCADSSFKVIIDLKVARNRLNMVAEVHKHTLSLWF